jgi:environmental stress-induced protein Ves
MSWQVVSLDAVAATPWRNGGGVTRELLAWPSTSEWQVRVSVAEVAASGPFSSFPGVERWFAVIEGAGVELRLGAEAKLLPNGVPIRFDGGVPTHCTLPAGPTRDINLMAPPGRGSLRLLVPGQRVQASGRQLLGLYAHERGALLSWNGAEVELPPFTFAWQLHEGAMQGQLQAGAGWWMEVQA